MLRGWEVRYIDGTVVQEGQVDWKEVKKNKIKRLTLFYDGRRWDLIDKPGYLQKKRASMIPGISESFNIESRSIGYYDGATKVWYTVDEYSGVMKMIIEE